MSKARPHPVLHSPGSAPDARTRVLDAAYELFAWHGVVGVGIDRIVATAGVAKMSLYRHFRSKEELVIAFLALREERWTRGWLEPEVRRLADAPAERLLAHFDVLDPWFRSRRYEGCSFIRTIDAVHDHTDPVHIAAARHIGVVRLMLEEHAHAAGASDPKDAAFQLHVLIMGAIVAASRGDRDAAVRARRTAELMLPALI